MCSANGFVIAEYSGNNKWVTHLDGKILLYFFDFSIYILKRKWVKQIKIVLTLRMAVTIKRRSSWTFCGLGRVFFYLIPGYMDVFSIWKFIKLRYYDTWNRFSIGYHISIKSKKNNNKIQSIVWTCLVIDQFYGFFPTSVWIDLVG